MALAGDVFIASEIGRLLQLDASKAHRRAFQMMK